MHTFTGMLRRPKIRPWMLKKELIVLYYAWRDKRTPLLFKIPAVLSLLYLLSPIDFIPDFIPFFGYVDDLIIVPVLLNLSIRLLPRDIREQSILKAERNKNKFKLLIFACIVFLIAWITGLFLVLRYLIQH